MKKLKKVIMKEEKHIGNTILKKGDTIFIESFDMRGFIVNKKVYRVDDGRGGWEKYQVVEIQEYDPESGNTIGKTEEYTFKGYEFPSPNIKMYLSMLLHNYPKLAKQNALSPLLLADRKKQITDQLYNNFYAEIIYFSNKLPEIDYIEKKARNTIK